MDIEIYGTGAHNAGAELMAHAIRQWAEKLGEHVRCAVNEGYGTYDQRAQAELATAFPPGRWTRSGIASLFFTNHFLKTYGIFRSMSLLNVATLLLASPLVTA